MFKDGRYINAGDNEIYRYGRKAVEKASVYLEANDRGYYSFPVDGGKYWTMGTSEGKFGEFMRFGDALFSVNKGGFAYAKVGTDKADKFVNFVNAVISEMNRLNARKLDEREDEE